MWIIKLLKWFGKVILKIILLPIMLLTISIRMVVNVLLGIGSIGFFLALLICVYGVCATIYQKQWEMLIIWALIGVIGGGIVFAAGVIVAVMEEMTDHMLDFMLS